MDNKKRLEFWNELDKPTEEIDLMKFEKCRGDIDLYVNPNDLDKTKNLLLTNTDF